jgi:hypothetical protein
VFEKATEAKKSLSINVSRRRGSKSLKNRDTNSLRAGNEIEKLLLHSTV